MVDLPYIFVVCALNHKRNFTPRTLWLNQHDPSKEVIRNKETGKVMNFTEAWDEDAQVFIANLRKYIRNTKWFLENEVKESGESENNAETKEDGKSGESGESKNNEETKTEDKN